MEKSPDLNSRDESARLLQQQTDHWKQPYSLEEIRRQLGWGLMAYERKDARR